MSIYFYIIVQKYKNVTIGFRIAAAQILFAPRRVTIGHKSRMIALARLAAEAAQRILLGRVQDPQKRFHELRMVRQDIPRVPRIPLKSTPGQKTATAKPSRRGYVRLWAHGWLLVCQPGLSQRPFCQRKISVARPELVDRLPFVSVSRTKLLHTTATLPKC